MSLGLVLAWGKFGVRGHHSEPGSDWPLLFLHQPGARLRPCAHPPMWAPTRPSARMEHRHPCPASPAMSLVLGGLGRRAWDCPLAPLRPLQSLPAMAQPQTRTPGLTSRTPLRWPRSCLLSQQKRRLQWQSPKSQSLPGTHPARPTTSSGHRGVSPKRKPVGGHAQVLPGAPKTLTGPRVVLGPLRNLPQRRKRSPKTPRNQRQWRCQQCPKSQPSQAAIPNPKWL